jgi:hypothetical protein
MLDPARLGINLAEFFLNGAADIAVSVKENASRTGGPLVQSHNILFHQGLLPLYLVYL